MIGQRVIYIGHKLNNIGHKLKKGKFRLDISQNFFPVTVMKSSLPKEVVDAPSSVVLNARIGYSVLSGTCPCPWQGRLGLDALPRLSQCVSTCDSLSSPPISACGPARAQGRARPARSPTRAPSAPCGRSAGAQPRGASAPPTSARAPPPQPHPRPAFPAPTSPRACAVPAPPLSRAGEGLGWRGCGGAGSGFVAGWERRAAGAQQGPLRAGIGPRGERASRWGRASR